MKLFPCVSAAVVVIIAGVATGQPRNRPRRPAPAAPAAPAADQGRVFCCAAGERSGQQYQLRYNPAEYSLAAIASVTAGNRASCESLGGAFTEGRCAPQPSSSPPRFFPAARASDRTDC